MLICICNGFLEQYRSTFTNSVKTRMWLQIKVEAACLFTYVRNPRRGRQVQTGKYRKEMSMSTCLIITNRSFIII